MEKIYNQITDYLVESGKRIHKKAGQIEDIGVTKKYLTQEDLNIERGLKEIIKNYDNSHELYAEEENDNFLVADNVWVCDPISGTRTYIYGLSHYGMAVAHIYKGKVQFGAVYDPSVDDLYVAYRGKGAFLNNKKIKLNKLTNKRAKVVFHLTISWNNLESEMETFKALTRYELYRSYNSQAVSFCHLLKDVYDGLVCLSKDSFPVFAGSLIIQEAGGICTNIEGDSDIKQDDRIFIAGKKEFYAELNDLVKKVSKK